MEDKTVVSHPLYTAIQQHLRMVNSQVGTGQKPCNPGFALRKTWVTGFLSCTKNSQNYSINSPILKSIRIQPLNFLKLLSSRRGICQ